MTDSLTYGEAHLLEKESLTLVNGNFKQIVHVYKKKPRMNRKDGCRYYNIKLFNHWLNDYVYNKRATMKQKKELVSALMFGHKDTYKQYKELV